MVYNNQKVITS